MGTHTTPHRITFYSSAVEKGSVACAAPTRARIALLSSLRHSLTWHVLHLLHTPREPNLSTVQNKATLLRRRSRSASALTYSHRRPSHDDYGPPEHPHRRSTPHGMTGGHGMHTSPAGAVPLPARSQVTFTPFRTSHTNAQSLRITSIAPTLAE